VGKNWTVRYKCRDKKEEIWLDWTHSTKKLKWNLPQRFRMEPTGKKITWTPQSHLEAHCFGGMRENIIWRTTSSSQKPPSLEAEDGWPMLLTESGGYVCMYVKIVRRHKVRCRYKKKVSFPLWNLKQVITKSGLFSIVWWKINSSLVSEC
jgi:hypothetical protein